MNVQTPILTLLIPSRLKRETRAALRFALRNPLLDLKTLGAEFEGTDPIRLMVGRFDIRSITPDLTKELANTCVCWLEREDDLDVNVINTLIEWAKKAVKVETPMGLLIGRELIVDGETWREQLVPRVWNPAAHEHLAIQNRWEDIDWVYHADIRIRTLVESRQITGKDLQFSIDDQDQLLDAVIFHQLVGDDETVLNLTSDQSIDVDRMGVWCSLQTIRADALRKMQRTEEAAKLSLSISSAYEDYALSWFVYGCSALELGKYVGATGAFRRAQKCAKYFHVDLYSEPSVWEWQAILGILFSRVALGDYDGVRSKMDEVYDSVPEPFGQRLTLELTRALIDQKEVLLAWDIVQPRLERDAVSAVPVILNICEYYVHQDGKSGAFKWMLSLSSNYGELLSSYSFCDALYQLASAVGDSKSIHDILWIMMEFDEAPESVYDALAADLFGRGRIDEASKVQDKRKLMFPDDPNISS